MTTTTAGLAPTPTTPAAPPKTVLILGVSYGGGHAAKLLASQLPEGWRVVAIDRNSHMNHVYVFPRVIALPQHAPKAFPPYTNLFNLPAAPDVEPEAGTPASFQVTRKKGVTNGPHVFIHGEVTRLDKNAVTFRHLSDQPHRGNTGAGAEETIPFDYCIYALGASLPAPCDVWGENDCGRGTKAGAVEWMTRQSGVIERAQRVLVVGGGALGIQFSTDIKNLYPNKEVTLLHSRTRMLPRYPDTMHEAIVEGLARLGIRTVLGQRVITWPTTEAEGIEKIVRTDTGETYTADLVLACTGQKPHSGLMAAMDPATVNPTNGRIAVRPTTQVKRFDVVDGLERLSVGIGAVLGEAAERRAEEGVEREEKDADLDHMFAIGDCADTVAIQAGHVSYYQGVVAVKNILKLIQRDEARRKAAQPNGQANGGEVNGNGEGSAAEANGSREEKKDDALETYTPTPPMIKLTLGLKHYATAMPDGVTTGDDGVEDLQSRVMWGVYHAEDMPDDA